MSLNLKCKKLQCQPNWNVTKTEKSPKLKYHSNKKKINKTKTLTQIEISPKIYGHQNWNVTKIKISSLKLKLKPKLKCHKKIIVTKAEMWPKLKYHQN